MEGSWLYQASIDVTPVPVWPSSEQRKEIKGRSKEAIERKEKKANRTCKLRNLTPRTGGKKLNAEKGRRLSGPRVGGSDRELFRKACPVLVLSLSLSLICSPLCFFILLLVTSLALEPPISCLASPRLASPRFLRSLRIGIMVRPSRAKRRCKLDSRAYLRETHICTLDALAVP